ncbi:CotH kinase family protein [Gluconobacter sp. NFX36]
MQGDLPDIGTTPSMSVTVFDGSTPLFSASGTWQVQGQTSQYANKKNWKFKLRNSVTGNKLAVKIGSWFPMSSIDVKGYGTDRALVRDSLTTHVWRQMHSYPNGRLAPLSAYQYFDRTDLGVHASALFSTTGFPVEIWRNGSFLGLYVLRASNDPDAYLMDDGNDQHILIQPQKAADMWTSAFSSKEWDFTSPDLGKNYDTGADVSTINKDVNDASARFITWMQKCYSGELDIRATYRSYIDLTSFLDYILIVELSGSMDALTNNWMGGSWNGTPTSGIWHIWPYDEDATWGLTSPINGVGSDAENIGFLTGNNSKADHNPGFFNTVFNKFRPELRARWRELRRAGVIDAKTITSWIVDYVSKIDPDMMKADLANWDINGATGSIDVRANPGKQSVSYIIDYATKRIAWIDTQWGYSA